MSIVKKKEYNNAQSAEILNGQGRHELYSHEIDVYDIACMSINHIYICKKKTVINYFIYYYVDNFVLNDNIFRKL